MPNGGEGVGGPRVLVACTSLATLRLAAERGLPMLLGMHSGDEEKREMVTAYRAAAKAAGHPDVAALGAQVVPLLRTCN